METKLVYLIVFLVILVLSCVLKGVEAAEPSKSSQVVDLLKQGEGGIMATIEDNAPYVSSTPFVLDKEGRPVIFISDLARHTANLEKNPHASIIINKPDKKGSYFNGSRVTLNGKMVPVTDEKEAAECRKVYMKAYKEAEQWADFGDFNYHRMDIKNVYLIGGFGEIDYVDLKDYREALKK